MNDTFLRQDGSLREPPKVVDPFELFGIAPKADLDPSELRSKFLALSRAIHPDRFQATGGEELARAEAWSGVLNRAWALLRDTRGRVLWLLDRAGLYSLSDSEAVGTGNVPQDLLMEVFELREILEDAGAGAADLELGIKLEASRGELVAHLSSVAKGWQDAATAFDQQGPEAAKTIASDLLSRQRFLERLLQEVEKVLSQSS